MRPIEDRPVLHSAAAVLVLLTLVAPVRAEVYFGEDDGGNPVFSDRPAANLRLYRGDDVPARPPAAGTRRYAEQIEQAAAEAGLDPALLHAVVHVESAYDPQARSSKGALGLMQLMPATAARLGVANVFDPAANLSGGARHLRELLAHVDGDLPLALAAYNAGIGAVRRHAMRIPPFPETRRYVAAVMRRYATLRGT